MDFSSQHARIAAVATTADPVRRALLDFAVRGAGSFDRDDAAEVVGVPRATAAFHLDKLAELGLLSVEFRRRGDRVGPGAGRPAKFYRATIDELAASVPERHYDLAADLLAEAVEQARSTGSGIESAMDEVAGRRGRAIGTAAASLDAALDAGGYDPRSDDGDIVLDNCPFHRLAVTHTATMCGLNHTLLRGVLEGAGESPDRAELAPSPGRCCVRITAR